MARTISIGAQGFEDLRAYDAFYVDKTKFIRDWWESRDQVTLVSGSVRVKGEGIQAVTLSPGEQLSYDRLLGDSTVRTVDTGDYVSWIRSQISLEDCTLGKVIENLEHRYRVKVSTLGDIDLDQHITLKINDESKEKIFTVLSFLADCELRIIDEGNIVLIR